MKAVGLAVSDLFYGRPERSAGAAERPDDPRVELEQVRRWKPGTLEKLGAEVDGRNVLFIMRNGRGAEVGRKIRAGDGTPLRTAAGEVKSLTAAGSKNGLIYKPPLAAEGPILVVEGEPDVCAALSAGYEAVVGTAGASPGRDQLRWLGKLLAKREAILAPHGDAAGRNWRIAVGRTLANAAATVRFIVPETGLDLDDRLRGAEDPAVELKELLDSSVPWGDDPGEDDGLSQGERLCRIVEAEATGFFLDQFGAPHVVLPFDGHEEIWPTSSGQFRERWLAKGYRDRYGHPPNSEALRQAQTQANARCHGGGVRELACRVAWHEGSLWYDLGDADWPGVKITKGGWGIEPLPPCFRRYKTTGAQVKPQSGGDLKAMLTACNVPSDCEALFCVTVASFFVPQIVHPLVFLFGEHGSGKSFTTRIIKNLVDPATAGLDTQKPPYDEEAAVQALSHHWLLALDNLSHLPRWLSDTLCRAVTGEGLAKRELFSDAEDFIISYQRCVVVNSIGNLTTAPDLLDRSILIETEPIKTFRDETLSIEFWNELRPAVLGGAFDALAQALGRIESVDRAAASEFRLGDFALWGSALAPGLGFSEAEFIDGYRASIGRKVADAIEASGFASALSGLLSEGRTAWRGTPTELLETINPGDQHGQRRRSLPESPVAIGRALSTMAPLLRKSGIDVRRGRGANREWLIERASGSASSASASPSASLFSAAGAKAASDGAGEKAPSTVV
jgi:hypothetical protein